MHFISYTKFNSIYTWRLCFKYFFCNPIAIMVRELEALDRLTRDLQAEKLATQATAKREINKEQLRLKHQQDSLENKMAGVRELKNENTRLVGENQHLSKILISTEREVQVEYLTYIYIYIYIITIIKSVLYIYVCV